VAFVKLRIQPNRILSIAFQHQPTAIIVGVMLQLMLHGHGNIEMDMTRRHMTNS